MSGLSLNVKFSRPPKTPPPAVGSRFGKLVVTAVVGSRCACACSCGNGRNVTASDLRRGSIQSCGCMKPEMMRERNTTHGQCKREEYLIWASMIQRCTNPSVKSYGDYGGRGISVCREWRISFPQFLSDVGPRPSADHTIDRIENNGNYEPGNVRWATLTEQANNKTSNVLVTIDGTAKTVANWSRTCGLSPYTIYSRVKRGITGVDLISTINARNGKPCAGGAKR